MSKELNSNTSFTHRLSRSLNHGRHQVASYWKEGMAMETRTFYVVGKEILSTRHWHQKGCPAYIVSGSLSGCKGFLK